MQEPTLLEELWANRTLVWLFSAFVIAVLFTFRPGSRSVHRDSANIPFRHDDTPAPEDKTDAYLKEAHQ